MRFDKCALLTAFQEYFIYIEPIVKQQKSAKLELPGRTNLTLLMYKVHFSLGAERRSNPQPGDLMFKSQHPLPPVMYCLKSIIKTGTYLNDYLKISLYLR